MTSTNPTETVERIAREQRASLLRAALAVTHNRDDAEDAVQRALLTALRNAERIRPETALAYLRVCAANEAKHLVAERSRVQPASDLLDSEHGAFTYVAVYPDAEQPGADPRAARLASAWKVLSADEAMALREQASGASYADIAARHGWTYTKVNRSLTEGRARLRRALAGGQS